MAMEVRAVIDSNEEQIPTFGSEDGCSVAARLSARPLRLVFFVLSPTAFVSNRPPTY
jgi:hypothetical protein